MSHRRRVLENNSTCRRLSIGSAMIAILVSIYGIFSGLVTSISGFLGDRELWEDLYHTWGGAAKCHLTCLDLVEKRGKKVKSNLVSLEHRWKIESLLVIYMIYSGETTRELQELVSASLFYHCITRRTMGLHHFVVDLHLISAKRYASSCLMRQVKRLNNLPATVCISFELWFRCLQENFEKEVTVIVWSLATTWFPSTIRWKNSQASSRNLKKYTIFVSLLSPNIFLNAEFAVNQNRDTEKQVF